jgi:hypothetical protein
MSDRRGFATACTDVALSDLSSCGNVQITLNLNLNIENSAKDEVSVVIAQ